MTVLEGARSPQCLLLRSRLNNILGLSRLEFKVSRNRYCLPGLGIILVIFPLSSISKTVTPRKHIHLTVAQ